MTSQAHGGKSRRRMSDNHHSHMTQCVGDVLIPNMHNFFAAPASETEKFWHGARSIHDVCVVYMCCPGPLLPSSTRTIYSYRNTTQKETSLLGQSDGGQPRRPTDGSITREWVSYMTRSIAPGHPLQCVLYIYIYSYRTYNKNQKMTILVGQINLSHRMS